jgi:phosphoribosylcarboxyaminoimidazole (NCAIR) mutase
VVQLKPVVAAAAKAVLEVLAETAVPVDKVDKVDIKWLIQDGDTLLTVVQLPTTVPCKLVTIR